MQTPQMSPYLMQAVPMDGFQKGWEAGLQRKREEELKRAMSALALNPYDPKTQADAAPHNPQAVMQVRLQQVQEEQQKRKDMIDWIGRAALQARTPQQMRATVQQLMAMNNPNFPQEELAKFLNMPDEQWPAARNALIAQAGLEDKPDRPQLVSFTEGGGVARWNPQTNQVEVIVQPNPGGYEAGSPVQSQGPTATGPNGEKIQYNPQTNSWEPMGGSGGNVGGGFR
jgi:hypothetical protein